MLGIKKKFFKFQKKFVVQAGFLFNDLTLSFKWIYHCSRCPQSVKVHEQRDIKMLYTETVDLYSSKLSKQHNEPYN